MIGPFGIRNCDLQITYAGPLDCECSTIAAESNFHAMGTVVVIYGKLHSRNMSFTMFEVSEHVRITRTCVLCHSHVDILTHH